PVYHLSSFLGAGTPIFDIRDAAGITDMLIRDNHLGDSLAKVLGDRPVALMRGHGSVVVGNSIQQAVYRVIYTEINARLQMDAVRIGSITFLSPEEATKSAAMLDAQVPRAWELWKSRIGKIEKPYDRIQSKRSAPHNFWVRVGPLQLSLSTNSLSYRIML